MNDEWIYGRNKRGCEGIFPISYVDIKVPLKNTENDSGTGSRSVSVSPAMTVGQQVRVLYSFNAEMNDDLTISVSKFFFLRKIFSMNELNKVQ
jgi:SH3 domain-containing protein 19